MRKQGVNPGLSVRKNSIIGIFLPTINSEERGGTDGLEGSMKMFIWWGQGSVLGSN